MEINTKKVYYILFWNNYALLINFSIKYELNTIFDGADFKYDFIN